MKRVVAAAVLLVLAPAGAAAPPEAKKGERPAKEGKVAEKPGSEAGSTVYSCITDPAVTATSRELCD